MNPGPKESVEDRGKMLAWLEAARNMAWLRAWNQTETAPAWGGAFLPVISLLEELNRGTEEDFLRTGGKLMEFQLGAGRIAAGLEGLTAEISGEPGRHSAEVLHRALDHCRAMERRTSERSRNLATLSEGALAVRNTFAGFRDAMATVRVLLMLTRIETARLGGAGADFGFLTDDVKSLAATMEARLERVTAAASELDRRIREGTLRLTDLESLLRELSSVVTEAMASQAAFADQQVAMVALSGRLVAGSGSVREAVKDAVRAIQFHDITRQQVEHVIEVLRHAGSTEPGRGFRPGPEARIVLTLQSSQLNDAERKFVQSVDNVGHELERIATAVAAMAGEGARLEEVSGGGEETFFRKLEHCLAAVLATTRGYEQAERQTVQGAAQLDSTLEAIRAAAAEIRLIDIQMLRVALNASIRAAEIGGYGETLGVLAGALQDLAAASERWSDVMAGALEGMEDAVLGLAARGDIEPAANICGQLEETLKGLRASSSASAAQIRAATRQSEALCTDIRAVRGEFRVGAVFAEASGRARELLSALTVEHGGAGAEEPPPDAMAEFAARYTMEAERAIHAEVFGKQVDSAPAQAEDDDGVELF